MLTHHVYSGILQIMQTAEQKRYHREYNLNNRDKTRAASRRFRNKNKETLNAYNRSYLATLSPEKKAKRSESLKKLNKISYMVRLYGITPEQRDEIFVSQGSCCAICKTTNHGKRTWHTDHCHSTKKVRGVLCHHCNLLLGQAKDNIDTLKAAIKYLRRK